MLLEAPHRMPFAPQAARRVATAMLLLGLGACVLAGGVCRAESPTFVIQTAKQGYAPRSEEPQLDTTPAPVFVIQEIRKQTIPPPKPTGPGVVGLDMLIHPSRYPVVQYVFPGTPADRQGMQAGDTIVAVNGEQTMGKTLRQVDQMISDVPGDLVDLTVVRQGRLKQVRLEVMALEDVPRPLKPAFSALFSDY